MSPQARAGIARSIGKLMDQGIRENRRVFGWIGTILLFVIIPIKLMRFSDSAAVNLAVGIAPSVLGPPGLMFLLLSSTGRFSRLTLAQTAVLAGAIAVGLESAQLLPRPGILRHVRYTFDYLDLVASLGSLVVAYGITRMVLCRRDEEMTAPESARDAGEGPDG
jgi:hypothetical protein